MGSRVHLINPSDVSFGVAVITPRWLYVLAAATGTTVGRSASSSTKRSSRSIRPTIAAGDVVGIGIHTGNALRGYEIGRIARERGAWVVYGGIHATLFPDEAHEHGGAHAVVKGDGDLVWPTVVADCFAGTPAARLRRRTRSTAIGSCRRAGICCRQDATCGRRCRPCAAARSTARSARSGAPTARSRGSASVDRGRARDRRAAAARVPLHRAGRRQLLSGHASTISRRRARRVRPDAPARARGAARRSASS